MSQVLNRFLETKISSEAARKLPNQLTLLRFLLVPIFVLLLCFPFSGSRYLATGVFLLAALTDYFDGTIARYFSVESSFGKLMDPLADKVLTMAALVMMLDFGDQYSALSWLVVTILAREMLVTGLRSIAALEGKVVPASHWGKYKTVVLMIALTLLLLGNIPGTTISLFSMGVVCLWFAAGLTIGSGLHYAWQLRSLLKA